MHDAGKVVPAIRDRPNPVGYEWLWRAFQDLNTCRSYGMGPGPIPWTAIEQYARADRLNADDSWVLHNVIRQLDNVWLDFKAKTVPKTPPAAKPGGKRGR
jgi:hypothetical protein